MGTELRWWRRVWLPAALVGPAAMLALLWWRAWLYRGWPGPPIALAHFALGTLSGESAYDLALADMFLWSLLALASCLVVRSCVKARRAGSPPGAA